MNEDVIKFADAIFKRCLFKLSFMDKRLKYSLSYDYFAVYFLATDIITGFFQNKNFDSEAFLDGVKGKFLPDNKFIKVYNRCKENFNDQSYPGPLYNLARKTENSLNSYDLSKLKLNGICDSAYSMVLLIFLDVAIVLKDLLDFSLEDLVIALKLIYHINVFGIGDKQKYVYQRLVDNRPLQQDLMNNSIGFELEIDSVISHIIFKLERTGFSNKIESYNILVDPETKCTDELFKKFVRIFKLFYGINYDSNNDNLYVWNRKKFKIYLGQNLVENTPIGVRVCKE